MIWSAWHVRQAALLNLMILYTGEDCLRESLEVPKGSQSTCSVWCGSRGGYGANARVICLISIWFWVHWEILHSWGDFSVLLVLWQCFWGLSGVQSSKSRLLNCFIGKTQFPWKQCRWIGPHLTETWKSHVFSRVAAGTCGIFSSYGEDVHTKLEFVQWNQYTLLFMRDKSGMSTRRGRSIRTLLEFKWEFRSLFSI